VSVQAVITQVKEEGDRERRALARNVGRISRFTALSRVLGLMRDQLFAALVGAGVGIHADAFVAAFRIPNLLRDLFAEGALSAAFIPTYARVSRQQGRIEAERLAGRLLTLLLVVVGVIVLAGWIAAPLIVSLLAPGFAEQPGKTGLTIALTRLMMPFLLLISLAALAMGILNAEERYDAPALAPALFNVVALLVGLVLWLRGFDSRTVVFGWAGGVLLGGLAQLMVQFPDLRRMRWRLRLEWAPRDQHIREILWLMAPATIGLAAVQINIFLGSNLASHQQGAQAWLQNAFRILYLPIGLIGVAIGTVTTTGAARHVAAGDFDALRQAIRRSLRMAVFFTIPATAGLIVLARPIVRLLFERGRYGPDDTEGTSIALGLYALGLVAYTLVKVLAPAFYSLGTARVPLMGSVASVATSVVIMMSLHPVAGFGAVALGTSMGAFVNVGLLVWQLERRLGGLRGHGLARSTVGMGMAACLMAGVCWVVADLIEQSLGTRGIVAQLGVGVVPVVAGVLAYFLAAQLLRIGESAALLSLLRGQVRRPGQREG
jgi:putative peptidoglycan lipid II flippase